MKREDFFEKDGLWKIFLLKIRMKNFNVLFAIKLLVLRKSIMLNGTTRQIIMGLHTKNCMEIIRKRKVSQLQKQLNSQRFMFQNMRSNNARYHEVIVCLHTE